MEDKCKNCGMAGAGYKCDECGAESAEHDPMHSCGGDHCLVKCSGCSEADTKCVCPPMGQTPSAPSM